MCGARVWFVFLPERLPLSWRPDPDSRWGAVVLCCLRSTRANQTTKFIDFRQIMNRRPLAVGAETSLNRVYRLWRGMGIRESRASASSQAHEATWRWPPQTNATTWHSPPRCWSTASHVISRGCLRRRTPSDYKLRQRGRGNGHQKRSAQGQRLFERAVPERGDGRDHQRCALK